MSKFNKDKLWLVEEYVTKNRSREDITKECGLTVAGLKSILIKFGIKKLKICFSENILKDLVDLGLSHQELETKLGIALTTLYRYLKKYKLLIKAKPKVVSRYDDSNDLLICQLYLDGFSSTLLGEEFGVSHRTILNHLEFCGINRRTLQESQWVYNLKTIPEEFSSYEKMFDLYIVLRLSKKDSGKKFNCDPCVIDKILLDFNILIRGNSESKIGLNSGEKHWNWKGGITSLARRLREFSLTNLVPKVLKRDLYTCQLCGSKHELHVHHIDSFSSILKLICEENPNLNPILQINTLYQIIKEDSRFNNCNNLITYCKDCHFYKIHKYKKSLADFKSCELLETLELESGRLNVCQSAAMPVKVGFNDYPGREYTQVSGSARHFTIK